MIDPGMTSLFITISVLVKPQVLWDVGANIGYYSWLMLSRDPNMRVVLLEPDPENARLIRETIRRASLQFAELHEVAISDQDGEAAFLLDNVSSATGSLETIRHSFIKTHYGIENQKINVKTITLDTLCCQRAPNLVKIDTEGSEERVLKGAQKTITTHQPILVIECCGDARNRILPWLNDMGYTFFDADRIIDASENTSNFLCLPFRLRSVTSELLETWKREFDHLKST
ncbi:MAG: FkbM family methyltransferase [Planctomycetota bacterium]